MSCADSLRSEDFDQFIELRHLRRGEIHQRRSYGSCIVAN